MKLRIVNRVPRPHTGNRRAVIGLVRGEVSLRDGYLVIKDTV